MATKTRKSQGTRKKPKSSTTRGRRRVHFETEAPPRSKVAVAGTFNGWDPGANPLRHKGKGKYAANLMLPPGQHEYKFVINGEWQVDTGNDAWTPNDLGTLNSIIHVTEPRSPAVHA